VRARTILLSVLSSTAVLVLGWQLGSQGHGVSAAGGATTAQAAPATGRTQAPSSSAAPTPSAQSVSGTFTGSSVSTRYGNVQVQVTVQHGSISDVTALQLTNADNRSVSISNRAAPILKQEVLAAQSAKVQGVSGATYTSQGYLTSLQSALDKAGL